MVRIMGDYRVLKRKDSKGKPFYCLAILADEIGKNGRRRYSVVKALKTDDGQNVGNRGLANKLAAAKMMKGVATAKDTLRDFLLDFWDSEKSEYLRGKRTEGVQLSSVYCSDNQQKIETHFLPWFESRGITRLAQLDRRNLTSWRNDMFEGKTISPASLNKVRQCVWVALQWAVDMEMIPDHPGKAVRRVHEPRSERPIFELTECNALFALPWKDARPYAACLLALTSGARMGEVRGLLVKNAHLDEGYIDILTNYVAGDGMKPPKWGSVRKDVPIPDITVGALRSVLSTHPWGAEPDQFVFFSTDSVARPCDTKLIVEALFSRMKALEIPQAGRSFHGFRHTYVSYMSGKLPQGKLVRMVGHTNAAMDERYTHASDEDRKVVREAVAGLLTGKEASRIG